MGNTADAQSPYRDNVHRRRAAHLRNLAGLRAFQRHSQAALALQADLGGKCLSVEGDAMIELLQAGG